MATPKIAEETRAAQDLVPMKAPAVQEKPPEEQLKKAVEWAAKLAANLQTKTDEYVKRMGAVPQAGKVFNGFHHWDCLTYGPYTYDMMLQPPTYLPTKVIAAGDWAFMYGIIWINPIAPPFSPPPTTQLGGREFRARFETVNLSTVSDGPDGIPIILNTSNPWPSPAPLMTQLLWAVQFPDPGDTPHLFEATLTVDLTLSNMPYAAFSTWHFDPDMEPGFLGIPDQLPQWEYERPTRFLVYHR